MHGHVSHETDKTSQRRTTDPNMLDIKLLRNSPETVASLLEVKGYSFDVEAFSALEELSLIHI